MKKILPLVMALGMSVFLPACADRDDKTEAPTAAVMSSSSSSSAALVEKVTEGHLTTLSTFAGPGDLTGYVLQPKQGGTPVILYAQNQGAYVFYGTLIGPDGANLTDQDQEKYVTALTAKSIESNLSSVASFSEGAANAPYQMYVMADPNCSACHYFYENAKPKLQSGELRIEWILVGFVRPDSLPKAAAIMGAADPAKAIADNEAKFDSAHEEGGAVVLDKVPPALQAKVDANMNFMRATGLGKTPTLIYYGHDGKLTFIEGAPRDMAGFLKETQPTINKASQS